MRIALINPIARRMQGYHTIGSYIPQVGLQVLAQLTPSEHTVDIIDEIFGGESTESLIRRGGYDLVGVTAYTSGAKRAYEVAAECRRLKITCIMGGPHAWACPDEAASHFDAVAVGECDAIWPQILEDVVTGRLQPRYQGELSQLDGTGFGRAHQTLQPINGRYTVAAIQTSRGCPVGCEYCSVTQFNGAPIRRRSIDEVVDEWNSTPQKFIFVVDDNFFGVGERHADWSKELLRAIIARGKKRIWFSQTTLNMGDDPEGLDLAYKAGCRGMLVGFESFNEKTLAEFHKGINKKNLSQYQQLVDGFHRRGIAVFGGFIIGSEDDTADAVADTALSATQLGVDIIQVTNLTPLPGTKMFDRLRDNGQLLYTQFPQDWERYTFTETVYTPARMTPSELDEAIYELRYGAATRAWVFKRALRTLLRTRSISTAIFVLEMNRGWKRIARGITPAEQEKFGGSPTPSPRLRKIYQSFEMHRKSRWRPQETPRQPAKPITLPLPVANAAAAIGRGLATDRTISLPVLGPGMSD